MHPNLEDSEWISYILQCFPSMQFSERNLMQVKIML